MHRVIRDHLEEVLEQSHVEGPMKAHLEGCEECRSEVESLREQVRMLRELRAEAEPRPGFYARVMERIETQGPASIWNVFSDSLFGRRLAVASMALAMALGVYLITSEQMIEPAEQRQVQFVAGEDQPGIVMTNTGVPDRDAVLVNLVTYREQ